MDRGSPRKIWLSSAKLATLGVAFLFLWALSSIKTTVRLQRTGHDVAVEIAHTPRSEARWIYITGSTPLWSSSSLIQSEGDGCAILHRLNWKRIPLAGTLEVRVEVRDGSQKLLETVMQQIILGPEPE